MNGQILATAQALINETRQDEYGPPKTSFTRIAGLWGAYLGKPITAHDVAVLMALLKLGREAHSHKPDNLIDAAGYIGLAADMAEAGNQ